MNKYISQKQKNTMTKTRKSLKIHGADESEAEEATAQKLDRHAQFAIIIFAKCILKKDMLF